MKQYRCLIVDDEPIAIRVVRNHLQNFHNIEVTGECANAIEAISFLTNQQVDLIFLDIQMPQLNGLELIRSLPHPPLIIFTTAYRDFAVDAFELGVIDYLLKPISLARFAKAIGKFYQQINESNAGSYSQESTMLSEYIFLKADKKTHKIDPEELIYIESLGDYVVAHTKAGKIVTKEKISNLYEMLPHNKFLRIHRSYIVSIRYIDAILAGCVEIGTLKIPIGRNYREQVKTFLAHKSKTSER
jgi:DNA-binding LytR/AlgR family response regulator